MNKKSILENESIKSTVSILNPLKEELVPTLTKCELTLKELEIENQILKNSKSAIYQVE